MHEDNCFVTLTYDDENLPYGQTLVRSDYVKFFKRFRKNTLLRTNISIRQYYCGEYGTESKRPHYHAIIFGFRPTDGVLFSEKNGIKLYTSEYLTKTWGMGHCTFGELTFDSAAYCARYITQKITGDLAEKHYQSIDPDTGEVFDRLPEFNGMSRRPGIGLPWLVRYGLDSYSKDQVILRKTAMKPPRAYDIAFERSNPAMWATVRSQRVQDHFQKPINSRAQTYNYFLAQDKNCRAQLPTKDLK